MTLHPQKLAIWQITFNSTDEMRNITVYFYELLLSEYLFFYHWIEWQVSLDGIKLFSKLLMCKKYIAQQVLVIVSLTLMFAENVHLLHWGGVWTALLKALCTYFYDLCLCESAP